MSFDELAKKIKNRDKVAFEKVYDTMRTPVFAIAFSYLRNRDKAEEVTQDTFVTVWNKIDGFRGRGFKTWIYAIAKNKALTELKKLNREVAVDFYENENLLGSVAFDDRVINNDLLSSALKTLDETEFNVVTLYCSGIKVKEIAKHLNIPRGTVSWKYSNSIKKLKEYMEKKG